MQMIADLHTHSTYSDGSGRVADNVAVAMGRGLKAVAITDHGPRSPLRARTSFKDLERLKADVQALGRKAIGIRVLAGVECNIISATGTLDVPPGERDGFDLILAGLHPGIRPASGRDWLTLTGSNWAARVSRNWRKRARALNTKAIIEAVFRNDIDIITHPGHKLDIDTVELARACALRDTAMEISAKHNNMTVAYCRAVAREGCRLIINSDAHSPEEVGRLGPGIAVALEAGIAPEQILNSEHGGLFEWLERRRAQRNHPGGPWDDWSRHSALGRAERERQRPGQGRSYWQDWSEQGPVH